MSGVNLNGMVETTSLVGSAAGDSLGNHKQKAGSVYETHPKSCCVSPCIFKLDFKQASEQASRRKGMNDGLNVMRARMPSVSTYTI